MSMQRARQEARDSGLQNLEGSTWAEVTTIQSSSRDSKTETDTLATACNCHRPGNHLLLPFILYFHTMHTSDRADSSRTTPTAQDAAIRSQVQERSDRKPLLHSKDLIMSLISGASQRTDSWVGITSSAPVHLIPSDKGQIYKQLRTGS